MSEFAASGDNNFQDAQAGGEINQGTPSQELEDWPGEVSRRWKRLKGLEGTFVARLEDPTVSSRAYKKAERQIQAVRRALFSIFLDASRVGIDVASIKKIPIYKNEVVVSPQQEDDSSSQQEPGSECEPDDQRVKGFGEPITPDMQRFILGRLEFLLSRDAGYDHSKLRLINAGVLACYSYAKKGGFVDEFNKVVERSKTKPKSGWRGLEGKERERYISDLVGKMRRMVGTKDALESIPCPNEDVLQDISFANRMLYVLYRELVELGKGDLAIEILGLTREQLSGPLEKDRVSSD